MAKGKIYIYNRITLSDVEWIYKINLPPAGDERSGWVHKPPTTHFPNKIQLKWTLPFIRANIMQTFQSSSFLCGWVDASSTAGTTSSWSQSKVKLSVTWMLVSMSYRRGAIGWRWGGRKIGFKILFNALTRNYLIRHELTWEIILFLLVQPSLPCLADLCVSFQISVGLEWKSNQYSPKVNPLSPVVRIIFEHFHS